MRNCGGRVGLAGRRASSLEARQEGGTSRISDELPVWGWSKGDVLLGTDRRSTSDGRNRMTGTGQESKLFDIPKTLIWRAYQKVLANKGAAGVDGQSLEEFKASEKDNLYKLWNRLSSGSYFPPPVRAVEIPKRGGGV